ncbi:MAG: hypothetical protein WHS88_06380 [Anaerohalosphaeraceae bacterium]
MRKRLCVFAFAVFLAGCSRYQAARIAQPAGPYVPAIYAAAQINDAELRNEGLRNLAARKDLTEGELDYLVCLLAVRKGTSPQVRDVLLQVLNHPAVSYRIKHRISSVLPNLGLLPADQKQIADALAPVPTESQSSRAETSAN